VCYARQHRDRPVLLPAAKGRRLSVFGLMTPECELRSWMVEGSIDANLNIAMLDEFAATLTRKTVVVLDNAPTHRSRKFMARIKYWSKSNLLIYFLPPYSPEINLIEILWRRIKHDWLPFDAFLNFQNLKERLSKTLNRAGLKCEINFC
jgi:transposase